MNLTYVLTSRTLCIYDGPNFIEVAKDHPNFIKITALLSTDDACFDEIKELSCVVSAIKSATSNKVEIMGDKVYYNGSLISNAVVDAIFDYQSIGLPIEPIVKFLENLMENPSKRSVEQLWTFIDHHKLPLTEDGYLLAYKCVGSDYMDKYSGKISNAIGQVIKMNRNQISDDPDKYCDTGLHVGGLEYSGPNGWYSSNGDKCIIVKVNPRDVVCVPHDHNATKIRVCEYTVIKDYCDILKSTTYDENYDECEVDCCDDDCGFLEDQDFNVGDIVMYRMNSHEVLTEPDSSDYMILRNLITREIIEVDKGFVL